MALRVPSSVLGVSRPMGGEGEADRLRAAKAIPRQPAHARKLGADQPRGPSFRELALGFPSGSRASPGSTSEPWVNESLAWSYDRP